MKSQVQLIDLKFAGWQLYQIQVGLDLICLTVVDLCVFDLDLFKVHLAGDPASEISKVRLRFEGGLLSGH